jgi:dephospho-CoA kinase
MSSFVLGLTGGIATGKTTAVHVFEKYGFPIVDGDKIAREVVEPGTPGLAAVVQHFGKDILNEDGTLDRKKLGKIVFSDPEKREQLNRILNSYIRTSIKDNIQKAKQASPLVIVDIPLLYEGHYDKYMDQTAVVYLPEEKQLQRLMARDGFTREEAMQRVESQMPIEEKKRKADILFDNQQTKDKLAEQIISWLQENKFIS